ncbi:MAG: D-inositol 3-phosphate glycosyltransferase [Verrucomicrobia bacterium ADurb.Bin474]|nr:MAG: D-inositol 3-phosphate glycosyltransferase [Verrucomicrobia bacterium ADurb.Bin474]
MKPADSTEEKGICDCHPDQSQPDVLLIGNYVPDQQHSMNRFLQWLESGLSERGIKVEVWRPDILMARPFKKQRSGMGKWLGYCDKFLIFPMRLKHRIRNARLSNAIIHVVDHSNASYMAVLPPERSLITCHDVLAIRGALGDPSAWARPSPTGRIFQHWIRTHLLRCRHIVCVSETTRKDLIRIPGNRADNQQIQVIPNGIDPGFSRSNVADALPSSALPDAPFDHPFLLHVGTAHPRKNRISLITAFESVARDFPDLRLVFVGEAFSAEETRLTQSCPFSGRVIHAGQASDSALSFLYRRATGFLFPSLSEGFGWPVLEAQACGCPVACSNISSLPEVAGKDACLFDPFSTSSIAQAMRALINLEQRQKLIEAGSANCKRFAPEQTIDAYIRFYSDLRIRPDRCF